MSTPEKQKWGTVVEHGGLADVASVELWKGQLRVGVRPLLTLLQGGTRQTI